jgi:hypothetical protein
MFAADQLCKEMFTTDQLCKVYTSMEKKSYPLSEEEKITIIMLSRQGLGATAIANRLNEESTDGLHRKESSIRMFLLQYSSSKKLFPKRGRPKCEKTTSETIVSETILHPLESVRSLSERTHISRNIVWATRRQQ